jgi:ATP-dependent protease ClpP protease subunit
MEQDSDDGEDNVITEENYLYNMNNHIYFSSTITSITAFNLCKKIRSLENIVKLKNITQNMKLEIFLHLTTDGGCITSAFSIIDCMEGLSIPVHTVIDSNVSSAGTLISVHGVKRYICKNSYVLIHELRSGVIGKLSYIDDNYNNCIKIQEHINSIYINKTKINKKILKDILVKDIQFNAEECIKMGIADELYNLN